VRIPKIAGVVLIGFSVACGGGETGGAGGGVTEKLTPHGLSLQFAREAQELHRYIGEFQSKPLTPSRLMSFRDATRRRVTSLEALARTDADRNALLIIALIRAKDVERQELVQLDRAGGEVNGQDIKTLYETRLVCDDELRGWVGRVEWELAELEDGECLAEAIEAADDLGLSATQQR
jgi:hypothetical protein